MSVLTFKSQEFKTFPPLLKEYANYMNIIKGNSEKTVCEYLLDLRTFFRYLKMTDMGADLSEEEMEELSISDVTLEDAKAVSTSVILQFLVYLNIDRKNGPTTRMRKMSALRSFYTYLHTKKGYIDFNPTVGIDPPKKGSTLPKYLTLDECVQLLDTVRSDTESKTRQRDYSIIALFLNTGMRLSELVGLNLQSFDRDLTRVTVTGKGNKQRVIYLNSMATEAVTDYLRIRLDPRFIRTSDNAFFLSGRQQRISNKTVQFIIYKYLNMAGLGSRGLSVHKLRHTAATLMYQTGKVDIRLLKDILGHEQLNTTQIYTHVASKNMEEAMEQNPLIGKMPRENSGRKDDDTE